MPIPKVIVQNTTLQELSLPIHLRISGRSSLSGLVWYIANNRSQILLFLLLWEVYALPEIHRQIIERACCKHQYIDAQKTKVFETLSSFLLPEFIN